MNRPTILVIDDSQDLLFLFRHIFDIRHYDLITRSSDEGLIDFVTASKIDLLLLDVMNGSHDCRHYCKEIKANPAITYLRVILMSANSQFLKNFKDWEADACIEKPFEIDALLATVSSTLSASNTDFNDKATDTDTNLA